jgi:hypothetical protein
MCVTVLILTKKKTNELLFQTPLVLSLLNGKMLSLVFHLLLFIVVQSILSVIINYECYIFVIYVPDVTHHSTKIFVNEFSCLKIILLVCINKAKKSSFFFLNICTLIIVRQNSHVNVNE